MNVTIEEEHIDCCYRSGKGKSPGKNINIENNRKDKNREYPRNIIVKFTSYHKRREVFNQKKKLKGAGIIIKEDLTVTNLKLYKEATRLFGIRKVWTYDGLVYIDVNGVRSTVNSVDDLVQYRKSN